MLGIDPGCCMDKKIEYLYNGMLSRKETPIAKDWGLGMCERYGRVSSNKCILRGILSARETPSIEFKCNVGGVTLEFIVYSQAGWSTCVLMLRCPVSSLEPKLTCWILVNAYRLRGQPQANLPRWLSYEHEDADTCMSTHAWYHIFCKPHFLKCRLGSH